MSAADFSRAEFLMSCGLGSQLPPCAGAEIAFCGRSNVGKSSLLNKLCNRKALARVSSSPGKTTTINFFSAGQGSFLVDLPGYGYAQRAKTEKDRWAELMESYFSTGRDIRLALLLIDMRRTLSGDDEGMLEYIRSRGIPFMAVLTKADKLNKTEYAQRLAALSAELEPYAPRAVLPFSVNGEQRAEALRAQIKQLVTGE